MNTYFFDVYQKQYGEWQKKFFDTWLSSFSSMGGPSFGGRVDLSETFDRTINLQQEFVNTVIKAQGVTTQIAIDTQQKFWDNYFSLLRKTPFPKAEFEADVSGSEFEAGAKVKAS